MAVKYESACFPSYRKSKMSILCPCLKTNKKEKPAFLYTLYAKYCLVSAFFNTIGESFCLRA